MSDNVVKIESHVKEFTAELQRRIPTILEAVGLEAEGNAIDEANKLIYDTPPSPTYVRTGRLKNSITHQVELGEDAVVIGSDVKYAPYVELGTYRMASRPFLRNAVNNYKDDYKRILEEGLK